MAVKKSNSNLVWLDLEMTGLDVKKERIIEIATIVTDKKLNILAEGPVMAIHQSPRLIKSMDKWNTKTHTKSGLVQRVKDSKIKEAEAEKLTIEFLKQYVDPGKSPLCGNSVWQDRRFLEKYMPKLEAFFHYRLVDVSTFKECSKRWAPKIYKGFKKHSKHEALEDIRESIEELKYYRDEWILKSH